MRLPAWSVLLPAWVGTGLLAPFVVAGPLVVVSVATEASSVGDGSFEPWVGPVVYSSFGAQAVGIALTFALYARARWPRVLRSRGGCRSAGPRPVLASAAWVAAVVPAAVAAARLLWALDPAEAASCGLTDVRGTTERAADAGDACAVEYQHRSTGPVLHEMNQHLARSGLHARQPIAQDPSLHGAATGDSGWWRAAD